MLAQNQLTCEYAEFEGSKILGNASDVVDLIPLILKGSIHTVRYDIYDNEVPIYNINIEESCVISITSVYCPGIENGTTISNEDVAFIMIPKSVVLEWMEKYPSWLEFTFKLNEKRMDEPVVKIN